MKEQELKNHKEEMFFLNNFNIDRVFGTIEKADYLFLYYIRNYADELAQGEKIYLSALAETMRITIPEISKAVENLQDKGYVLWKTDSKEGKTYVELTSKAIELMRDEKKRITECYKKIREEVGEEELMQMIQTMKKVTEILKHDMEEI